MAIKKDKKKRKDKKRYILLILLLLMLIFLGWWFFLRKNLVHTPTIQKQSFIDSISTTGTASTITAQPDTTNISQIDTTPAVVKVVTKTAIVKTPKAKIKDSVLIKETVELFPETTDVETIIDPCKQDTIAPWVYPDPSGGLHYRTVKLMFISSKPCSITWRFSDDTSWKEWNNEPIFISNTTTIEFQAKDSCGNILSPRIEKYEIGAPPKPNSCPNEMAYIHVGKNQFCIDKYEWPNKKGVRPKSNISIYHAMDSCFLKGKRLCKTDEWSIACGGIYSWKYPYGERYEPKACVTSDTTAMRSGMHPECRGYFNIFDMSGNLAEWTATPSKSNKDFYNVMGGFWESGPQGGCFTSRYSYFPQNHHNPVGFRCCKDIEDK